MAEVTREQVLDRLAKVKGPDLEGDIVSLGLVENVLVNEGKAIFSISVPAERAEELEPLRVAAEKAVSGLEGIEKVTAVLTAERKPQRVGAAAREVLLFTGDAVRGAHHAATGLATGAVVVAHFDRATQPAPVRPVQRGFDR